MTVKCSVLECFSIAVATSTISNRPYCNSCALKVMAINGPELLKTIPDSKFPWDVPVYKLCEVCGNGYNNYLLGLGGECPSCRTDIKGINNKDKN